MDRAHYPTGRRFQPTVHEPHSCPDAAPVPGAGTEAAAVVDVAAQSQARCAGTTMGWEFAAAVAAVVGDSKELADPQAVGRLAEEAASVFRGTVRSQSPAAAACVVAQRCESGSHLASRCCSCPEERDRRLEVQYMRVMSCDGQRRLRGGCSAGRLSGDGALRRSGGQVRR